MLNPVHVAVTIAILFIAVYSIVQHRANQKKPARYSSLTFQECYIISCLLTVSRNTIYGELIHHSLQDLEDAARMRRVIEEIRESILEAPESMEGILGKEAFCALVEYANHKSYSTVT